MKAEYDFSTMKARRNPYASKLKRPVTMRLSEDVVAYQSLINLYLRDCIAQQRKVQIKFPGAR